jgi:hypothetical protein
MTETVRLDFISLIEIARRYRGISGLRKQAIFRSQGYFSPAVGGQIGPHATSDYSPWIQMLEQWTSTFLSLVDTRASASTKKSTPMVENGNGITTMKAISVIQPWVNLLASGQKTIETRLWHTDYRGPLIDCVLKDSNIHPAGYALAIAELIDCRPMMAADEAAACCARYAEAFS